MRRVEIGVLLVMGLCLTFTSAGYIRSRMGPLKSVSAPSYAQPQPEPVKIEVEKESSEEEGEEDSYQPTVPIVHRASSIKVESPESTKLTPTHSATFSTVTDGERHISFTTQNRNKDFDSKTLQREMEREAEDERINLEQNQNAKYFFASAVDDGIMDQSQVRQESRDGLKVKGSYSYSDGYVKRTINYEADEGGYRVVSEESEPIGEGPQTDLINGKAEVHTQVEGVDTQYSIKADEIAVPHSSTSTFAPPEVKEKKISVKNVKQSSYNS